MRRTAVIALATALLAGCEREDREFRADPVATETEAGIAMTSLSPGQGGPERSAGNAKAYEENAYHISQGKKFFTWFNCKGCHANGGGGSGPALMDDRWVYGGGFANIVQTIEEGRPNGMPSFRGKIPDEQIRQIAAYVRSMGRYVPKAAAPGRNDDMFPGKDEQRRLPDIPIDGGTVPPSAEAPQ
jgi:cytochrome c oxidase cbb3-type subunit 3